MEVLLMKFLAMLISPLAALILSPLIPGVINRTKAMIAGRQGPPLLQVYYDLFRLFRKGSVFSTTTSWLFRAAPVIIFATTIGATCFIPLPSIEGSLSFSGDIVFLLYLLAFGRFFLILSALDTGSAFEGMGASREAFFSALAEPVAFICLINVMKACGAQTIGAALSAPALTDSITLALTAIPLFLILLCENARIPIDDPTTHLELTMIHEVMILDNSGSGLALMEYAASLKLWLFSLILGRILLPRTGPVAQVVLLFIILASIAVLIGAVESMMARVRMARVPQLIIGAGIVALLGFLVSVTNILLVVRGI